MICCIPFYLKKEVYCKFSMLLHFHLADKLKPSPPSDLKKHDLADAKKEAPKENSNRGSEHIAAQTFTFRELAMATRNFRANCLVGEGGFGRVYKGRLESINQVSSGNFYCPIIFVLVTSNPEYRCPHAKFSFCLHPIIRVCTLVDWLMIHDLFCSYATY